MIHLSCNWTEVEKPPLEPDQTRRDKGTIIRHKVPVRCAIYRNAHKAEHDYVSRLQKRQLCEQALQEFTTKLNKNKWCTKEACQKKIDEIVNDYLIVKPFVNPNLSLNEHGAVLLSWSWDEKPFENQKRYDGIFALLTNHPTDEVSVTDLITRYRERNQVEVDWGDLRGLLDVIRIFVQLPERVDAYVFLKILAYFVLAFLRWYAETRGKKKVTEAKVQDALSKMGIGMIKIEPLGIPKWSVANDDGLANWFRTQFNLEDPREAIDELNRLVDAEALIQRWLEMWQQTRANIKNSFCDSG